MWHRAYLVKFEQALQAADVANGNDGDIGLPYWDCTDTSHPEIVHAVVRMHFTCFNTGLFPSEWLRSLQLVGWAAGRAQGLCMLLPWLVTQ